MYHNIVSLYWLYFCIGFCIVMSLVECVWWNALSMVCKVMKCMGIAGVSCFLCRDTVYR